MGFLSNKKHQAIFNMAQESGEYVADLVAYDGTGREVGDLSGMAYNLAGRFAEKASEAEVEITPAEQQIYAAGFVDGYKRKRRK